MVFKFAQKYKTKTLLAGAGFLVIAGLVGLAFWFYFIFLFSRDSFIEAVPAEAVVYWHESAGKNLEKAWLYDATEKLLLGEARDQAKFLFENVGNQSLETSFAILPGFEDFIFWGVLDVGRFNNLKEKLEESKFNYIFEDDGKITITNTKFALKEVLAVMSQRAFSLIDQKIKLMAFNRVAREYPLQVYFNVNFNFRTLKFPAVKSDFWIINQVMVVPKSSWTEKKDMADFYYLIVLDGLSNQGEAEMFLKRNLAILFPEIKEKILQDQTTVREIVADPDRFKFERESFGKKTINVLKNSELGEEVVFGWVGRKMILSTSRQLMINYFNNSLGSWEQYYGKNLLDFFSAVIRRVMPKFGGVILGISCE